MNTMNLNSGANKSEERGFFSEVFGHIQSSVLATIGLTVLLCVVYPLAVWLVVQIPGLRHQANGSLLLGSDGKTVVGSRLIGQSFSGDGYFHPRPSAAGNGYDPTSSSGSNLGPTSAKLINGTTKPATQPSATPAAAQPTSQPAATQPAVVVDFDGIKLRTLLYAQENKLDVEVEGSQRTLKEFQNDKGEYDQVKLILAFNDSAKPLNFHTKMPIPADAVTGSGSGLDPHISLANAMIQLNRVAEARKMKPEDLKKLMDENVDQRDLGVLGEQCVNVVALNYALDHRK